MPKFQLSWLEDFSLLQSNELKIIVELLILELLRTKSKHTPNEIIHYVPIKRYVSLVEESGVAWLYTSR